MKLGDFGLCSQLEHSYSLRTTVCGTTMYMAPETYRGESCLKSDVWALGISVIEMAEGKHPFQGSSPFVVVNDWQYDVKIMKHVIFATPPSLSSSEWSSDLVDFVSRCMVRDVKERASVDELLQVSSFNGM